MVTVHLSFKQTGAAGRGLTWSDSGLENVACAQCRVYEARIAAWERRLAALAARLGTTSSNSSLPPSPNPLGAPKPVTKKKAKRCPGGQPGHPPHLKHLWPPQRVNDLQTFVPHTRDHCPAPLLAEPSPDDPEPTRFQTIELPPVVVVVTEYQGHARTCPRCGHVPRAALPRELLQHSVGPRRTATLASLTGGPGVSQRGVEEIAAAVFDAPVALGTVANLEQEMSAALAAPHQEALAVVRAAAVQQADETSWQRAGQLCWRWAAAPTSVVALVLQAQRRALGLAALVGVEIQGIRCRARWHVYPCVPAARRQVCWAHRKRDCPKIVDRDGPSVLGGREGRPPVHKVFAAWQAFREGHVPRAQLQATLSPVLNRLQRLLRRGAILGADSAVATFCENLLALEAALGTFVDVAGVEPPNHVRARLRRRAVRWRKRRFGRWSAAGGHLVERILTVEQTRRRRDQNVLDDLHAALLAHRLGQPCPQRLPEG
jgi:transposase